MYAIIVTGGKRMRMEAARCATPHGILMKVKVRSERCALAHVWPARRTEKILSTARRRQSDRRTTSTKAERRRTRQEAQLLRHKSNQYLFISDMSNTHLNRILLLFICMLTLSLCWHIKDEKCHRNSEYKDP